MRALSAFFTLVLSILFVLANAPVFAQSSSIVVKGKKPQGVVVQKNKVIAKKGYVFEKVSPNRAVARRRAGGGITGEFDCTCNGASGGCSVVTTPTSVSCFSSGCTSSCYMIVTIPGSPVPAVAR